MPSTKTISLDSLEDPCIYILQHIYILSTAKRLLFLLKFLLPRQCQHSHMLQRRRCSAPDVQWTTAHLTVANERRSLANEGALFDAEASMASAAEQ